MNVVCGLLIAASLVTPVENTKSWVLPRTSAAMRDIAANESRHFDVVMVGDSITEAWKLSRGKPVQERMLGDFKILNLGISGDTIQNVLWRFDQGFLDGYTADLFQVMIGTNNVKGETPEEIKEGVAEIIRRIREKHPEAKVLLLPIFHMASAKATAVREARNVKLKELADGRDVLWHDFNARFHDDGEKISKEMLYDGQHPNTRAQEIWAEEVRPIFARIVGAAKVARKTVTVEVAAGGDIAAAIEQVKAQRKPGDRGEVVLADGVYTLERGLELDASASHIVIRAKNPGKATVVGGVAVRGREFRPVTDAAILRRLPENVRGKALEYAPTGALKAAFENGRHTGGGQWYYRDWNNYVPAKGKKGFEYPDFPCLTIDCRRQELARWPNGRAMFWIQPTNLVAQSVKGKGARISTRTGREKKWDLASQNIAAAGWINKWRYLNCCTKVTAIDAEKGEVTLAESAVNPLYARAWFFNIPEEMDEPGEWCYDGKSGKVLLCPPTGFGADSLCAFGSTKDILFHITGDGIAVRGINVTAKVFHPAVVIEGRAAGNEIRGCRFSNIGYDCIWVGGRSNTIRDCELTDIVSMGIGVNGGDLKTMIPACNRVENNVVRHPEILCSTWAKSGIHVDGIGNRVAHNEVTDSVDSGLYFAGFDHVIEYNRVYDVCKEFDDVGAVYSPGGMRCYGNVFRYNDISGAPGQGVALYYDDTTSGHEAYGNVLRDAGSNGILVGGGRDNYIHDNVIVGGFTGIEMDNRGLTWPAYTKSPEEKMRADFARRWDVTNRTSAIARKHPQLLNWYTNDVPLYAYAGNRFERNVIVDPAGYGSVMIEAKGKTIDPKYTTFKDNLIVRTRGPKAGRDLVLRPENVATNEYSAKTPSRPPIGPCRVIDGTAAEPVDLGFVDYVGPAFDPWPYFGYGPQNWVSRPDLYRLRREGFESLHVKPWQKGDFNLKPGARLLKELPGFTPIPWSEIGPQR